MVEPAAECEKFKIIKTLGEGGNGVAKLALKIDTKELVVLKILKKDVCKEDEKEIKMLKKLDHDNITKFLDFIPGARYKKKTGKEIVKNIIVMEFASRGDFFNLIIASATRRGTGLSEATTRAFFKQMVETVEYCHDQGVVHRDIKPENILLDADYNVKLADFGWATILDSKKHNTKAGTERYRAPEMFLFQSYELTPIDIFSLGIILFMMRIGNLPFDGAIASDTYYQYFFKNKPEVYWEAVSKNKINEEGLLTEEFKELIEGMLRRDPEQRYTIQDIKNSKWYQGEIADKGAIEEEFELLRKTLKRIYKEEMIDLKNERKTKVAKPLMTTEEENTITLEEAEETKKEKNAKVYLRPYRSLESPDDLEAFLDERLSELEIDLSKDTSRKIKTQPDELNDACTMAFNLDLQLLFKSLVYVSKTLFLDSEISTKAYAISKGVFQISKENPEWAEVKISIYQVGKEGEYVVECMKKKGDYYAFSEFVDEKFFPALVDLVKSSS